MAAFKLAGKAEVIAWKAENLPNPNEWKQIRQQSLLDAEKVKKPIRDRVLDDTGLYLPDCVFTFWGFWKSLPDVLKDYLWNVISPCGVFDLFEENGLDRKVEEELNLSLHYRYYNDPPEFFTLLYGGGDGLHYGLWYDDVKKPSGIKYYWSNDGIPVCTGEKTLLLQVQTALNECLEEIKKEAEEGFLDQKEAHYQNKSALLTQVILSILKAFLKVESTHDLDNAELSRIETIDQAGVPCFNKELIERNCDEISALIENNFLEIQVLAQDALYACKNGNPLSALCLGRDLYWESNREKGKEKLAENLLVAAYLKLGKPELVRITKLHTKHRSRLSVSVFI